jgi:hypothetical protein
MTTYYVGPGGNDANSGLTWALRKLTLNGAEDTPVVAGDTVYVGPGTYRELLTVDVSGSAGSPITYIGDYLGTLTDGVGGVVRITGSDNDQTATRANCITATSKNYRTFQNILFDTATGVLVTLITSCGNWIIDKCEFQAFAAFACVTAAGTGTTNTIRNCFFMGHAGASSVQITHTSVVDNSAHMVENCLFFGGGSGVLITRVGGFTVRNCAFTGRQNSACISISTALTVGQTITVNNNLFHGSNVGLNATAVGEIVEDYNNFAACTTNRASTNTGANSLTYPTLFDARSFFQLMNAGAGPYSPLQVISPFDLASYSQLINVAGTSPTTTDLRGTAIQGAQRDWGALEYDSTLKIFGGIKKSRLNQGH